MYPVHAFVRLKEVTSIHPLLRLEYNDPLFMTGSFVSSSLDGGSDSNLPCVAQLFYSTFFATF